MILTRKSVMDSQKINFFSELDVSKDNYTLKVRIIRLWRWPLFNNPNQTYSIEMILLDEEDNRIQASCLSKWFLRFEKHFAEKACLIIKKPTLGDNAGFYKYIDSILKACFNYNTHVLKCSD